jgi:chromosome segregation ATPase
VATTAGGGGGGGGGADLQGAITQLHQELMAEEALQHDACREIENRLVDGRQRLDEAMRQYRRERSQALEHASDVQQGLQRSLDARSAKSSAEVEELQRSNESVLADIKAEREKLRASEAKWQAEKAAWDRERSALTTEKEDHKSKLARAPRQSVFVSLQSKEQELAMRVASLTSQLNTSETARTGLAEQNATKDGRLAELAQRSDQQAREIRTLQAAAQEMEVAITRAQRDLREATEKGSEARQAGDALQRELLDVRSEAARLATAAKILEQSLAAAEQSDRTGRDELSELRQAAARDRAELGDTASTLAAERSRNRCAVGAARATIHLPHESRRRATAPV